MEPRTALTAEAAARKLLTIILRRDIAVGDYTHTGVTNSSFTRKGGTIAEHSAGIAYGTEEQWFKVDRSGTRIVLFFRLAQIYDSHASQSHRPSAR